MLGPRDHHVKTPTKTPCKAKESTTYTERKKKRQKRKQAEEKTNKGNFAKITGTNKKIKRGGGQAAYAPVVFRRVRR